MSTYKHETSSLRYASPDTITLIISGACLAASISANLLSRNLSPLTGEGLPKISYLMFALSVIFALITVLLHRFLPAKERIKIMVRQKLYDPAYGNPLHLKDGDLLPAINCEHIGDGLYELTISAQASVEVNKICNAAPIISAALTDNYSQYAITRVNTDTAFNYVIFTLSDVQIDKSLNFNSVEVMRSNNTTLLNVDKVNSIDLKTSGSILVAGKTRSGKTTGVISLIMQALLEGPDSYNSKILIIDPKQAELSRLPYTATLDNSGEAYPILNALKNFESSIRFRQQILNDLSEQTGDAVKWWDAGMHPSFIFIDEYVACRSIFPKKAAKDSDYCLDTFDNLLKRIVTMGASAGCFVIISIAEASVQDGGLPAMLRSAMSTKILFRPTQTEGRLMWDKEKFEDFPERVYGPGDAWFSSTDGVHDNVSFVHFPHMNFAVYKELAHLLTQYYNCTGTVERSDNGGVPCVKNN